MNKVGILLVVGSLVLGGCTPIINQQKKVNIENRTEEKSDFKTVVVDDGVGISVDSPSKVSAVDFKLIASGGLKIVSFVPNKELFNSVMSNIGNEAQVNVSMGIMKPTVDLPEGRVLLGKVMTLPGTGKLMIKELKLIGPGTEGKPSQIQLKDFEFIPEVK